MIAFLEGQVLQTDGSSAIVLTGCIGYQVYLSARLHLSVGQSCQLYCSQQVREDSLTLYGFATWLERSWFELLLSVSGVGPKSALAIVGSNPIDRIEQAISLGQTALFEAIPGIGKKVAAKIIVELKGRVGGTGPLVPSGTGTDAVVDALESLGYRKAEVLVIIKDLPPDETKLENQIRWVLKRISRS